MSTEWVDADPQEWDVGAVSEWSPPSDSWAPFLDCDCNGSTTRNASMLGFHNSIWIPASSVFDVLIGKPWLDRVARAAGAVGLALALLSLLLLVCRSKPRLAQLQGFCASSTATPAFRAQLLEFKTGQMRGLLQLFCYLLMPVTVWLLSYSQREARDMVAAALLQGALALLALKPGAVTPRSLDAIFCSVALLVALLVTPFTCGEVLVLPMLILCNGLMAALVAVRRTSFARLPLLPAAAAAFAAAACSTILLRGRPNFGGDTEVVAAVQALAVLLVAAAAPIVERRARTWMYQLFEVEELQELLSASQCLLRSCFDVVVELDGEGCVVGSGQELAALLLRREQGMEGASFAELIEGRAEDFVARLKRPTMQGVGLAENMQASMRDACGNLLRLELMWFSFTRRGAQCRQRHFMLGLRELSEPGMERAPPPAALAAPAAVMVAVPDAAPGSRCSRVTRMSVAASEDSSLPETRSVSSGSFVDAGAVVVVGDAANGFPVKRVAASFRARVGPLRQDAPITAALKRPLRFQQWLAAASTAELPPRDCRLTFKMPQGNVGANCKVLKQGSTDEVHLLFYGMQAIAETEKSRPAEQRGTGAQRPAACLQHCARVKL